MNKYGSYVEYIKFLGSLKEYIKDTNRAFIFNYDKKEDRELYLEYRSFMYMVKKGTKEVYLWKFSHQNYPKSFLDKNDTFELEIEYIKKVSWAEFRRNKRLLKPAKISVIMSRLYPTNTSTKARKKPFHEMISIYKDEAFESLKSI